MYLLYKFNHAELMIEIKVFMDWESLIIIKII